MLMLLIQGQAPAFEPLIPELVRSIGAAGALLALMFVMGWVVAGRTSEKWEERYDALREQQDIKDEKLIEEIVPLLTRGVEVMARFTESQGRDE